MPDCHVFCKDMPQAISELKKRFDLSKDVIKELGIGDKDYELAIRFTEEFYNQNKELIVDFVKKNGRPVLVEMWKEKFFLII
jgi:threonyl-tRNA synthetase